MTGISRRRLALSLAVALGAWGCGDDDAGPSTPSPTLAERRAAATSTAQDATNACAAIHPFYWEVGDRDTSLVSGSLTAPADTTVYAADTRMAIASASKWIYGAYVAQLRNGVLTTDDIKFLTFRSGYTSFSNCLPAQSVDECVGYQNNGDYHVLTDGKFSYGGGHMEKHASQNGLGPLYVPGLAAEVSSKLGAGITLGYSQPQLAGGVYTTPADYARFLRRMLDGQLYLGALLGADAVCTNPATCPTAINSPVPSTESWDYSLGHWVETDPVVGDGAFSSAGAFGFYPWIDATKTWYGIVARVQPTPGGQDPSDSLGEGYRSVTCGRLIRAAWVTGVPQ